MESRSKLPSSDDINRIICAEIPNKEKNPELYEVIKESMIHGPCGAAFTNSPYMVDGKCSKLYPKPYAELTKVGKDGFPIYRRTQTSDFVEKCGFKCDNRYVVPSNAKLSLRYRVHINVEWCNQTGSIKYLFKYINKRLDRVAIVVEPINKSQSSNTESGNVPKYDQPKKNEIKDYFDCRFVYRLI